MDKKEKLTTSFLILGSGTIFNIIISVLTTPIITRLVGPIEYGKWSIFTMYTNMAVMVLGLGLDQSLFRYFYEEDTINYRKNLLKVCFNISMLFSLIILIIFYILVCFNYIPFEFTYKIAFMLCINILINIINRFSFIILRVTYKTKIYSICTVLIKATFSIFAIALISVFNTQYFQLLCISTIFSFLIPTLVAIICSKELWKWKFNTLKNFKKIKEILFYGLPFIISMGLSTLFQALDKISLNYFCSYKEVGIYSSAISIVNIFAIVQSVFNTMWVPIQVEHYVKSPKETNFFSKVNAIITVIMTMIGILLILCKDIIVFLLGKEYRQAAFILPFLIFHPIMYTISETTNTGIDMSKKSYLHIFVGLGALIFNFVGNSILVPILYERGAAISTGVSYIVYWALRTYFSIKYYKVNYHLKKFLILILLLILNALHATFYIFNLTSILLFLIILLFLLFSYYNEFVFLKGYVTDSTYYFFRRKNDNSYNGK